MKHERVFIETTAGRCKATIIRPSGAERFPAVIFYMDALGIRPGVLEMASRLAVEGYVVLLPDMYYRFGEYDPIHPREVSTENFSGFIGPLMASINNLQAAEDTQAFLNHLDARADVAGRAIGVVGFCMGGGMALTAAACYPDRIVAVASFHGSNLATDDPTSPHLRLREIKAELYLAMAEHDRTFPPAMAARFEAAVVEAGLRHEAEVFAGQPHAWMMVDMLVYDTQAAARGWEKLFALFARTLR